MQMTQLDEEESLTSVSGGRAFAQRDQCLDTSLKHFFKRGLLLNVNMKSRLRKRSHTSSHYNRIKIRWEFHGD